MPFNTAKAKRALWFFETRLTHTKGRFAGQPFKPAPWQRKILWEVFGTEREPGVRQYDTVYIEVAKKNGKSEFAAGLALCALGIDEEPGAECYVAATSRPQAGNLHRTACSMVRRSPELTDYLQIYETTHRITVRSDPDSYFAAISAEAGGNDGINPHVAVYDELHRVKNRDLIDVLRYGSDARTQPLFVGITTAGIRDESPVCWELHEQARQIIEGRLKDPSFYAVIYGLDDAADWTHEGAPGEWDDDSGDWNRQPTGWYQANPSLEGNPGGFLDLQKVRRFARVAKTSPVEENSFRRFRLNQWVAQESRALQMADWDACGEPFDESILIGKECFVGLDCATTRDFTALCYVFPVDDLVYLKWEFWLPRDGLDLREPRDIAIWARSGLIHTTPGNTTDYGFIRQTINDRAKVYRIRQIGKDPWNSTQLGIELAEQDGFEVIDIRQGFGSLSAPCKELERLVIQNLLRHGNNPVARWMADCYAVKQDPQGNVKPVKPDYKTSRKRIDGMTAAVMAVDLMTRNREASLSSSSVSFG